MSESMGVLCERDWGRAGGKNGLQSLALDRPAGQVARRVLRTCDNREGSDVGQARERHLGDAGDMVAVMEEMYKG